MGQAFSRAKTRERSRNGLVAGSIPIDSGLQDPGVSIEAQRPMVVEVYETLFFQQEKAGYVFLSHARILFIEGVYLGATS
jgi:hypothetical protein